jgi:hypothetical protein
LHADFKELLHLFNVNQVRYLVVGGVAFIFHAEPRYTKDIDVWISTDEENAERVFRSLAEFGAPIKGMTPDDFSKEGFFYQMGVPPLRIDVLMSITGLSFDKAWDHRVQGRIEGETVMFISKDDLITAKKAAGRPQDLIDANTLAFGKKPRKSRVKKNE